MNLCPSLNLKRFSLSKMFLNHEFSPHGRRLDYLLKERPILRDMCDSAALILCWGQKDRWHTTTYQNSFSQTPFCHFNTFHHSSAVAFSHSGCLSLTSHWKEKWHSQKLRQFASCCRVFRYSRLLYGLGEVSLRETKPSESQKANVKLVFTE